MKIIMLWGQRKCYHAEIQHTFHPDLLCAVTEHQDEGYIQSRLKEYQAGGAFSHLSVVTVEVLDSILETALMLAHLPIEKVEIVQGLHST